MFTYHKSDPSYTSCWIARDGTFYPVEYARHNLFAAERVHSVDPVDALEHQGWVHISIGGTNGVPHMYTTHRMPITQAQEDTLYDMLMRAEDKRRKGMLIVVVREYIKSFGEAELSTL